MHISFLKQHLIIGLGVALMLGGCQQGGGNADTSSTQSQGVSVIQQDAGQTTVTGISTWSDADIAQAVYTDRRVPEDFYQLDSSDDAFYTTYQLKNTDLVAPADRDGLPVYELSTNDFSEALQWTETAAGHRPVYKQLVDTTETDLYFEFTRVDLNNPQFVDRYRVLKRSVVNRDGVDLSHPDNYHGTVTAVSASAELVKTLDEYFWTFSAANNYGIAVLESTIAENTDAFSHAMVEARLQPAFDGSCDTITVVNVTYSTDKASGDIYTMENVIHTVYAQRNAYGFELCSVS
ncbi:MAG: hypothetical protein PVF34_11355 [Gammaproteobacteria bacterium]|jgi:hypothetical protein